MTAARARSLCPQAVFLRPRMDAYREASRQVMGILRCYTPLVEPLSLDEAFLDVTVATGDGVLVVRIGSVSRVRIKRETGLIASAGESCNKRLAKLASDCPYPMPSGIWAIGSLVELLWLLTMPYGVLRYI